MQIEINKVKVTDSHSPFNGQVVDITITDGVITNIKAAKKLKAPASIVADGEEVWKSPVKEGNELLVSCGWVDVFADYREPGFEQKETIETGLATAVAGGFTDVLLAPNTKPAISSKSIIQYIHGAAAGHTVNLHPIGSATQNADGKDLAEMLDMQANGAVAFSDGWKPIQNPNLMLKALEYAKAFDGTIVQFPVDETLSAGGLMNEGRLSTALGMPGVPLLAETLMIYRDIELLRYTGSRLHITGVSSAESVAMIKKAKAEGLPLTCSVTPYHLALTEDKLRTYDSQYKVSPPLRTEADRQALIQGLADGTIDCIASHHRPHEWDAKTKEFEYAADGIAIQEIAFNVLSAGVGNAVAIEKVIEALTNVPRSIFNLDSCTIKKGSKATLTLFTIEGETTVKGATRKSKGMNNPFLNMALPGKVIGICNNNQLQIN